MSSSVPRHPGTKSQTTSHNTKRFQNERKGVHQARAPYAGVVPQPGSAAARYGVLVTRDRVSTLGFFAGSRRTRRSNGAPNSVPLLGSLLAPLVGARSALSFDGLSNVEWLTHEAGEKRSMQGGLNQCSRRDSRG